MLNKSGIVSNFSKKETLYTIIKITINNLQQCLLFKAETEHIM